MCGEGWKKQPQLVRRWLLKTPWFLALLDDLALEYPDFALVRTHRDPAEAIGSSASVMTRTYGVVSDALNLTKIGQQQLALAKELLRRAHASEARTTQRTI